MTSSIDALIWIFLTTGFTIGFGHCIGMCGPIVISLSLNLKTGRVILPLSLYSVGRVITYGLLGGIMGLTGSFTSVTGRLAGFQKGAMIAAGLLVIAMGVMMSGYFPTSRLFKNESTLGGFISKAFNKLTKRRATINYLFIGLLLGLLPCGPVYTALIAAARAGMNAPSTMVGFTHGMLLMLAFGIGTIPALILVGKLTSLGWLVKRDLIYKIGAALMIIVGGYFVYQGIMF